MTDETSTGAGANAHVPDEAARQPRWTRSRGRDIAAALAMPVAYALNRPSLAWLARAAYDVALRMNGMAIGFKGSHGLTMAEERFLRAELAGATSPLVLDVGANLGDYAANVLLACPSARIVAFEPHPSTYAKLVARMAGTGVESIKEAMGREPGEATLYDFADNDGSTQASTSLAAVEMYSANTVAHQVRCTTVDEFVAARGFGRVALLKVDTEGRDLDVLVGAKASIESGAIDVIQFEFIPANVATRVFMRDFYDALPGYDLGRMCVNGQVSPLGPYDAKRAEVFQTQNVVARLRRKR